MRKTRAIVNVSTLKYTKGQYRLKESLEDRTDASIHFFQSESQVNAPSHSANKYAFKPCAIDLMKRMGYESVLWLDASMLVIKDIDPIFKHVEKRGYFAQDSGWMNDRWTTPEQKEYFGTDEGKMVSSGVLGLSFNSHIAIEFQKRWHKAMEKGMFHFNHDVSRQDQSCASLIIEQLKMDITPNETYWKYGTPEQDYPENILMIANGIC